MRSKERSEAQVRAEKAYNERNRELKTARKAQARAKKKEQEREKREQEQREQLAKYAQASSIKVLLSFKDYTEFSPAKKKL